MLLLIDTSVPVELPMSIMLKFQSSFIDHSSPPHNMWHATVLQEKTEYGCSSVSNLYNTLLENEVDLSEVGLP